MEEYYRQHKLAYNIASDSLNPMTMLVEYYHSGSVVVTYYCQVKCEQILSPINAQYSRNDYTEIESLGRDISNTHTHTHARTHARIHTSVTGKLRTCDDVQLHTVGDYALLKS